MSVEYPISCIRCRRRKIKCNKRKPCNHCSSKGVPCHFPAKFRNISIDEHTQPVLENNSSSSGNDNSESPQEGNRLENEVRSLKMEIAQLKQTNRSLFSKLDESTQASEDSSSKSSDKTSSIASPTKKSNSPTKSPHGKSSSPTGAHDSDEKFRISGETTEKGQKYYGPFSVNNMTEDFNNISESGPQRDKNQEGINHHSWTTDHFRLTSDSTDSDSVSSEDMRFMSSKKPLPWVVDDDESDETNIKAIKILIDYFFETKTYSCFLSKSVMTDFVDSHASIEEADWEGDDEMLLLHMVLILAVQRLRPATYNQFNKNKVWCFQDLWSEAKILKKKLFAGFSRLRHNLINESYLTVQAYILCTEWEFTEQRFEESWSMLFHCCSIAYSLGLHVVMKANSSNKPVLPDEEDDEDVNNKRKSEKKSEDSDSCEEYYLDDFPKVRVWFALRNLCAQICSILGRPNPIMIRVNQVTLPDLENPEAPESQALIHLVNCQLKQGLSECLRFSNLILIESYMRKVEPNEVINMNFRYSEEANSLSMYLNSPSGSSDISAQANINPMSGMPDKIQRRDVLIDLIILHVNRVKLLEPFLSDSPQKTGFIEFVTESIILFLDHTCELVSQFIKDELPLIMASHKDSCDEIRLDKIFTMRDPFISSFIYQGIVVIFILLNDKANEFIHLENFEFLSLVERKMELLAELHTSISNVVKNNIQLWSKNNIFLMKKTLEYIGIIKRAFKEYKMNGQMSSFEGFDYDPQVAELLGGNLKDPFWIVNPDNTPGILNRSSQDENSQLFHPSDFQSMSKFSSQEKEFGRFDNPGFQGTSSTMNFYPEMNDASIQPDFDPSRLDLEDDINMGEDAKNS